MLFLTYLFSILSDDWYVQLFEQKSKLALATKHPTWQFCISFRLFIETTRDIIIVIYFKCIINRITRFKITKQMRNILPFINIKVVYWLINLKNVCLWMLKTRFDYKLATSFKDSITLLWAWVLVQNVQPCSWKVLSYLYKSYLW